MINRVVLVGRLTRDPELRYTQAGDAFCRFALAVSRRYTNKNGEREADFINIVTWRGLAETCARYLSKGSMVAVDGSIVTGRYEKDGQTVYTVDVRADNVAFLDTKKKEESNKQSEQMPIDDPFADDGVLLDEKDLPF
ncbi:single-stranded DNA-binding protein [Thermoactinomyces sp. FSL K6-2592]|jgi:single-strand DNA-binding protein|uniref:single-stranded DNA-binding protein n=1 Tax=Thermoactinomyces sp. FSL K6-2592 TaxID=2975347 RepID=UPI0030FB912B